MTRQEALSYLRYRLESGIRIGNRDVEYMLRWADSKGKRLDAKMCRAALSMPGYGISLIDKLINAMVKEYDIKVLTSQASAYEQMMNSSYNAGDNKVTGYE